MDLFCFKLIVLLSAPLLGVSANVPAAQDWFDQCEGVTGPGYICGSNGLNATAVPCSTLCQPVNNHFTYVCQKLCRDFVSIYGTKILETTGAKPSESLDASHDNSMSFANPVAIAVIIGLVVAIVVLLAVIAFLIVRGRLTSKSPPQTPEHVTTPGHSEDKWLLMEDQNSRVSPSGIQPSDDQSPPNNICMENGQLDPAEPPTYSKAEQNSLTARK